MPNSLRDRKLDFVLQRYSDLFDNIYQAIKLGREDMGKMFDLSLKGMVRLYRKERSRYLRDKKGTPVISQKDGQDDPRRE
jgi:hypothetical protein